MNLIKKIACYTLLLTITGQSLCSDSWWSRLSNWTTSIGEWVRQNPGKTATAAFACYLGYRYYCKKNQPQTPVQPATSHWTTTFDNRRAKIKVRYLQDKSIIETNGKLHFGPLVQDPVKKMALLTSIQLELQIPPKKLSDSEELLNELLNPPKPAPLKKPLESTPAMLRSAKEREEARIKIIQQLLEEGFILEDGYHYAFSENAKYPHEILYRINTYIFNNDQKITDLINQLPSERLPFMLKLLLAENKTIDQILQNSVIKTYKLPIDRKIILINTFIEEGYVRKNDQPNGYEFATLDNDIKLHILHELAKADHFFDESIDYLPYYFKNEHTLEEDNNLLNLLLSDDDDNDKKKIELVSSWQKAKTQWQKEIENQEKDIEKNSDQRELIKRALKKINDLPQLLLIAAQIEHNLVKEYISKINALRNKCQSNECSESFNRYLQDKIKDIAQKLTKLLQDLQQKIAQGKEEE